MTNREFLHQGLDFVIAGFTGDCHLFCDTRGKLQLPEIAAAVYAHDQVKSQSESLKKCRRTFQVVAGSVTDILTGNQSYLLAGATFTRFLEVFNAQEQTIPGPV
jgi:hypothetical protein